MGISGLSFSPRMFRDEYGQISGLLGAFIDITERKRAEETLRVSEKRYRDLVEMLPEAVFETDHDMNLKLANRRVFEMFGYSREDLFEGIHGLDLIAPEDRERAKVTFRSQLEGIPTGNVEYKARKKDGTHCTILMHANPIVRDEEFVGLRGVVFDISERKRWEEALHESENKYRLLVDNQTDLVVKVDTEGRFQFVSPSYCELFEKTEAELLGKTFMPLVHEEDREGTAKAMEDLYHPPYKAYMEQRAMTKDGWRWLGWMDTAILDENKNITTIIGVGRDITERKQAEQQLYESEARFKALHNASFGGIGIHDKGIIIDCNHGLAEMTGYTEKELIGMDSLRLIAEASRNTVRKHIESGYEKTYEAIGIRKNGEKFPIQIEARNIPFKGKMVRTVEFRDITERKGAEEERERLHAQLLQAQKMEAIGTLAGGIAHDFNNMLGVIIGNVEMAISKADPSYPLYGNLEQILNTAMRSADITRQLLAFARKQTIAPQVLDLNEAIERMLSMLRRLIGEDIDLAWLPATNLQSIRMDPSQIDQILANLCVNARDAIEGVGKLTIETGMVSFDQAYCDAHEGFIPGQFILLAVSDNGCGIDKGVIDHLFDPFFTTKGIGKGTGLGLAMVYGIVKQNNGFINVYSEPGQGTTFKIYLPLYKDEPTEIITDSDNEVLYGQGETVLIVEDEKELLVMLKTMLEGIGYKIIKAAAPSEAIRQAETHPGRIHLLVTDVIMPEMNGRDLAKRLVTLYTDLKVLFMSGYTANVIAHQGVLDEGVQFIQKPFSLKDLSIKVRGMLDEMQSGGVGTTPRKGAFQYHAVSGCEQHWGKNRKKGTRGG